MKQRYMTININVCIIKYKLKDNVDTFKEEMILCAVAENMQQMNETNDKKCKRKWLKNKKN